MQRGNLFEVDVTADERWNALWRGDTSLSREKQLMVAVLKSALISYQKYAFSESAVGMESYRDAVDWIESDEDEWFFSFLNICEHLDIAPDALRARLARWRRHAAAEPFAEDRASADLSD